MPAVSETKKLKNKAKASLALLVVALISITTATYAWFTLSNSTSVQSMIVEVSTGVTLKAYAGASASTNTGDYFSVIKSEDAAGSLSPGERITDALPTAAELGGVSITSLDDVKLWPVTSGNGVALYTQGGNASASPADTSAGPERKYYLQLRLTFLADTDMDVYLNGDPSTTGGTDGTGVAPNTLNEQADEDAVKALRISFEDNGSAVIYEPDNVPKGGGGAASTTLTGKALADSTGVGTDQNTFTALGDNTGRHKGEAGESAVLFSLKKGEPKQIVIRMWVEGEDAECVNNDDTNIEKAKLNVRLRFSGADRSTGLFIETPAAA